MASLAPDPWQTTILRSSAKRLLILCSRQVGKSTTAAALALKTALLQPSSLTLLLSPSLRQSAELFRKVLDLYRDLDRPIPTVQPRDSVLKMELANGSRVVSLPGTEETIRGFSGVSLLVVDEAARVPDDLFFSVRPMLATSGGRLVCLSTAHGKLGFFYDQWARGEGWERTLIRADQCRRIDPAFLAEERHVLAPRWYSQEYECEFSDVIGSLFRQEDIEAAVDDDVRPLFAHA